MTVAQPMEDEKRPEVRLEELLDKARGLEAAGEAGQAGALLAAAPEVMEQFGSFHYARGALAFRAGDLAEATRRFQRAVEIEPDIAEYWGNLGAALVERSRSGGGHGDLQRAAMALERAAERGPKLPAPYTNLGLALQLLGRHEEALEALGKALAIDPGDAAALYNVAATLHAQGREEDCLRTLDHLLVRHPGLPQALRSRCATLGRLGRSADAKEALAAYLEVSPGASDADELRALMG